MFEEFSGVNKNYFLSYVWLFFWLLNLWYVKIEYVVVNADEFVWSQTLMSLRYEPEITWAKSLITA